MGSHLIALTPGNRDTLYKIAVLEDDYRGRKMITDKGLLYMEPRRAPSEQPLIDQLTTNMAGALRQAETGMLLNGRFYSGVYSKGFHLCSCGARSSNKDYRLQNGEVTNSLATHYLAWHREEVSPVQLEQVEKLPNCNDVPAPDELVSPSMG